MKHWSYIIVSMHKKSANIETERSFTNRLVLLCNRDFYIRGGILASVLGLRRRDRLSARLVQQRGRLDRFLVGRLESHFVLDRLLLLGRRVETEARTRSALLRVQRHRHISHCRTMFPQKLRFTFDIITIRVQCTLKVIKPGGE